MEIVNISVSKLKEYENNPRINDAAVPKVIASIREFGFINPIAVTKDLHIISGHTRLRAAKKLGMKEVPCIIHDMTDEDAQLARIIDNKSSEYATWDMPKFNEELLKIGVEDSPFFTISPTAGKGKKRNNNLKIRWGSQEIPATEEEYEAFKETFDRYVAEHSSYLGFIIHLLEVRSDV